MNPWLYLLCAVTWFALCTAGSYWFFDHHNRKRERRTN